MLVTHLLRTVILEIQDAFLCETFNPFRFFAFLLEGWFFDFKVSNCKKTTSE